MKYFIGPVLLILTTTFLIWYCLSNFSSAVKSERERLKINLGKQVIISSDTLTIIDYSVWDATYTLSNGSEISDELVTKLKTF